MFLSKRDSISVINNDVVNSTCWEKQINHQACTYGGGEGDPGGRDPALFVKVPFS